MKDLRNNLKQGIAIARAVQGGVLEFATLSNDRQTRSEGIT